MRNIHFTESVRDAKMTFDYVLRDGPVQTTNALRLMRLIGIALDWDAEPGAVELGPGPGPGPGPHPGPSDTRGPQET